MPKISSFGLILSFFDRVLPSELVHNSNNISPKEAHEFFYCILALRVSEISITYRDQYVKVSNTRIVNSSMNNFRPQLSIAYKNSFSNEEINGKLISYADDTALLFSEITWKTTNLKQIGYTLINYHKTL